MSAVDLLGSREHLEAIALVLRTGGVVYLPCDGLDGGGSLLPVMEYCTALEQSIRGSFVTYIPRIDETLGPRRLWGRERLRFDLNDGAANLRVLREMANAPPVEGRDFVKLKP